MAGEGPPFLTVGTAVSAKYRGAFCEAKVKVVKKLVKCKIKFKNGPSSIVNDEFVKGPLKIGVTVEAKQSESSPYEEGTIMKLNDASLYTVVFDDGDEKTLRRTLLCLQGEKHFHESETLDHLPLTDPENFGTPVVKQKKSMGRNRRSSTRSQSDDEEEEEEEDEEEEESDMDSPRKQRKEEADDAVGKVVMVEMNEKRKNSSFPALVVDPSCTKDVVMRGKDQIVVRSFKDNKFYTVAKSSRKPFLSKDHAYKGDVASLKAATEKAVTFIDTGQLPSNWDLDMLRRRTKQGQADQVGDDTSEDSSDDEYDVEKDAWLASLHKFMEERGTPINKPPVLGFRDLNLYKLYKLVQDQGGCRKVTDRQLWRGVMSKMGIPASTLSQPYNIHSAYNKYLVAFEEFNRKMGPGPRVFTRTRRRSFDRGWITPQLISRQRASIKQEARDELSDKEEDETPKKRVTRKKGEEANKPPEPEESRESKPQTREAKAKAKEPEETEEPSDREEKRTSKKSAREEKTKDRSAAKEERAKERSSKEEDAREKVSLREERGGKDRAREEKAKEKASEEKSGEKSGEDRGKERTAKEGRGGKEGKEGAGEESAGEKHTPGKSKEKGKDGKGKEKKSKAKEVPKEEPSKSPDIKAEYDVGEKVLVHYGRGRTEKIYEAKVVDIEMKGKDHIFTVHYTGWNNRYDEAVKRNRIMGSAEKKKKHKIMPKDKPEKEKSKRDMERREKGEGEKNEREESKRKQEEIDMKIRQAKELEERQEKERLEKERAEKERLEKDRKEKQEKERKERQDKERKEKERKEKLEKERIEREKKDKQERERREQQEKERREKVERERKEKLEREQREKQEKEKQERDKKERQEREKREKQEKEKRDKEERDRKEREKQEQEKRDKEAAEKAKEAEKEKKERDKSAREGKRTPSGKRGRPSMSKASPAAPSPPRAATPTRGKSPSPASVFSQRSMRSDRKSLTESPFASGLFVRARSKRSSTGEYKRGTQDSDSEADEADDRSESQQSTQDSEDSSQAKGGRVQEREESAVTGTSKTEGTVASLTSAGEEKPTFDDDSDDGPPTLTAHVGFEPPEARLQDPDTDAPKVEAEKASEDQEVGRSRNKKDSKRNRKSLDRERDSSREARAPADLPSEEKQSGKNADKESDDRDDAKGKTDETPILERQVLMEEELKEKLGDINQEDKDSTSDADKPAEKRKGRKKGRKSSDSRKRTKNDLEADTVAKTDNLETFEPKRKHAKTERRKSEKGKRKPNEQDLRSAVAENVESDVVSSSVEEKSLQGTSKSFMTTPPTTPESSPKMPSSPSQEEDLNLKGEEQSSSKSDSDALIEVASIEDKDLPQAPGLGMPAVNVTPGAAHIKATPTSTQPREPTPKKRRRGASESEPGKKRRKHSRRRKSNLAERRHSSHQDRSGNNNSSDTDESRSESRLMSSARKQQFSMKAFAGNLPTSAVPNNDGQQGSQKQRRWNFLVDLSDVKEPDERIAIIQRQLSDLRSVYLRLKQEVATIDRRRKKFRKKEREAAQVMAGVALGHCLTQSLEKQDCGGS